MDVPIASILAVVKSFVAEKRGKPADAIGANTALLRDGYLDSFALVELIAELEKQLSISLEDGSLIPEDFETPQVLHDRLQEL
jgi:acyl carrier protein